MGHEPYDWTPSGQPCYRLRQAPRFLATRSDLADLGLVATSSPAAYVDSQYGLAALYVLPDTELADPGAWPPRR